MQNKGAIRLFAILFALICLYQLSFTWIVRSVEKDAENFADGDPALYQAYIDSVGPQPVYDLLVREYTYNEVKSRELNLGLDLKGGMNVILEVSVNDILRSLSNNSKNPIFNQAIDAANAKKTPIVVLTGSTGGKLPKMTKIISVPSKDTARIQECHILIGHIICEIVEGTLFAKTVNTNTN